ncbi:hypothetical protein HPB49_007534 [Dermacentor silvarum]|uniref:Uncharacterized protein n=1 Tax=Dermacentor silvarum TaxID=543639 RepID=A0ACB8DWG6_DERSI|nr:hypothetical protein HPB49_007534 [Dermacentor silvarum]
MVAAVTPPKLSYMETHNTMKYAERAMEIELQGKKNMLNVNVHMYSALTEEYKQEVERLTRKLDRGETHNTALEAEVRELKDGPASVIASRHALLRAQETGSDGSGPTRRCVVDQFLFRFPNGSPHPRRHRRSGSADMVVVFAMSMAPSRIPAQSSAASDTFDVEDHDPAADAWKVSPNWSTDGQFSIPSQFQGTEYQQQKQPSASSEHGVKELLCPSSLPRPMSAVTPTSRTAFLLSKRGQQQLAGRLSQPRTE